MLLLLQYDWPSIGKTWGPLGIGFVLGLILVAALLKAAKQVLLSSVEDARKERDYMRQIRERELERFLESLKSRDDKMERGFNEIVAALRNNKIRR